MPESHVQIVFQDKLPITSNTTMSQISCLLPLVLFETEKSFFQIILKPSVFLKGVGRQIEQVSKGERAESPCASH